MKFQLKSYVTLNKLKGDVNGKKEKIRKKKEKEIMKLNKKRMDKTFKYGLVGGLAGAFVGAPGLGIVLGVAHANKDKIRKVMNNEKNSSKNT